MLFQCEILLCSVAQCVESGPRIKVAPTLFCPEGEEGWLAPFCYTYLPLARRRLKILNAKSCTLSGSLSSWGAEKKKWSGTPTKLVGGGGGRFLQSPS